MDILFTPDKTNLLNETARNGGNLNIIKSVDMANSTFWDLMFSGELKLGLDALVPVLNSVEDSDLSGNMHLNYQDEIGSSVLSGSKDTENKSFGLKNVNNEQQGVTDDFDFSNHDKLENETESAANFNNNEVAISNEKKKAERENSVVISRGEERDTKKIADKADAENNQKTVKNRSEGEIDTNVSIETNGGEMDINAFKSLILQDDLKEKNPELYTTLENIISFLESSNAKTIKPEMVEELNSLLSKGVKLGKKIKNIFSGKEFDDRKQEILSKLEKFISILEENGVKPEMVKEVKRLITKNVVDQKSPELITKLENAFSVIDSSDVNQNVTAGKESLEKLEKIVSAIEKVNPESKISKKVFDLLSKDGDVVQKRQELSDLLNKAVAELNLKKSDIADKKNIKAEGDKAALNKLFEEISVDKIVNNKLNIDKKQVVTDSSLSDVVNLKNSEKGKAADGKTLKKLNADTSLENDIQVDAKVAGDVNKTDSIHSDRVNKIDVKTVSQNTSNSNFSKNQSKNKDKLMQQGEKGKSESIKPQQNSADFQIGSNKSFQTVSKAESFEQAAETHRARDVTLLKTKDMVLSGAKKFLKGGNSEVHLNITKPNLGNIKVSFIENSNGRLEVLMMAERPEAAEMLKQNSAEIKQLLLKEGIDLSNLEVFDSFDENRRSLANERSPFRRFRRGSSSDNGDAESSDELVAQDELVSSQDSGVLDDEVNVLI